MLKFSVQSRRKNGLDIPPPPPPTSKPKKDENSAIELRQDGTTCRGHMITATTTKSTEAVLRPRKSSIANRACATQGRKSVSFKDHVVESTNGDDGKDTVVTGSQGPNEGHGETTCNIKNDVLVHSHLEGHDLSESQSGGVRPSRDLTRGSSVYRAGQRRSQSLDIDADLEPRSSHSQCTCYKSLRVPSSNIVTPPCGNRNNNSCYQSKDTQRRPSILPADPENGVLPPSTRVAGTGSVFARNSYARHASRALKSPVPMSSTPSGSTDSGTSSISDVSEGSVPDEADPYPEDAWDRTPDSERSGLPQNGGSGQIFSLGIMESYLKYSRMNRQLSGDSGCNRIEETFDIPTFESGSHKTEQVCGRLSYGSLGRHNARNASNLRPRCSSRSDKSVESSSDTIHQVPSGYMSLKGYKRSPNKSLCHRSSSSGCLTNSMRSSSLENVLAIDSRTSDTNHSFSTFGKCSGNQGYGIQILTNTRNVNDVLSNVKPQSGFRKYVPTASSDALSHDSKVSNCEVALHEKVSKSSDEAFAEGPCYVKFEPNNSAETTSSDVSERLRIGSWTADEGHFSPKELIVTKEVNAIKAPLDDDEDSSEVVFNEPATIVAMDTASRCSVRSRCSTWSSSSSKTSDLSSSMSECSDVTDGPVESNGMARKQSRRERSYLLDMAGQDSSSGIASDDHHGIHSPGNSESSPTYSSAGSQSEMSRGERQGQGPTRVVNGDFNGSDPKGKSRCGRVLDYQKPNGYHETDLDDPSSDCTFIFSPALKAKKTSHDKLTRSNSYMEATQRPTATSGRHGDHQRQTSAPSGEHHASDLVDFTPRQHRISYFDILPDNVLTGIFRFLSSQELCRGARVCRRWYQLAWDPSLWTHVTLGVEDPSLDVDRALRSLTRRLSLETPGVCALVDRITLNGCKRLTDRGLLAVARRCPELRRLELQGCPLVSNIALFEVVSNCVNLEHLDVAGCAEVTCLCLTPQATLQAATYGKQIDLRYLDMTECQNLQDSGLQIIASYCTNLVHLYLRRCTQLTDIGVQYVANYCGNLREFSISDCPNVTDLALRELAKLGCNLRYLSVAKCERVTDIGVRYVARSCPKLRYLNVRGCEAITDVAMEAVARHCPRMRSLDIGKCDVTDVGLEAIAQYKLPLRKLGLKSCERVTDRGVEAVAKACKQLHLLNIQDCDVTIQVYRTVKRSCKHCLIEHTNPGFF